MFITLKTFYFIILSLIIGYIFYSVYVSENFKKISKKTKVKSKVNSKVKPQELWAINYDYPGNKNNIVRYSFPCGNNTNVKCEWTNVFKPDSNPFNLTKVYQGNYDIWGITSHNINGNDNDQTIYRCSKQDDCSIKDNWKVINSKMMAELYIEGDNIYGMNYIDDTNNTNNDVYYKCRNTKTSPCKGGEEWKIINNDEEKNKINKKFNNSLLAIYKYE